MRLTLLALISTLLLVPRVALADLEMGGPNVVDNTCADRPIDTSRGKTAFMAGAIASALAERSGRPACLDASRFCVGFPPFRWTPPPDASTYTRVRNGGAVVAFLLENRVKLGGAHLGTLRIVESFPTAEAPEHTVFRIVESVPGVKCDCEAQVLVRTTDARVVRVESSLVDVPPNLARVPRMSREAAHKMAVKLLPEIDFPADDEPHALPELHADPQGVTSLTWVFQGNSVCVGQTRGQPKMGYVSRKVAVDAHTGAVLGYVKRSRNVVTFSPAPKAAPERPRPRID